MSCLFLIVHNLFYPVPSSVINQGRYLLKLNKAYWGERNFTLREYVFCLISLIVY